MCGFSLLKIGLEPQVRIITRIPNANASISHAVAARHLNGMGLGPSFDQGPERSAPNAGGNFLAFVLHFPEI
jgi:hypothetical protein